MFQQKSTETITLTKTQLQAILELITQVGGINNSEVSKEQTINENRITYPISESDKQTIENQFINNNNNNQLIARNNYWEPEKENLLARSDWYRLKDNDQTNSMIMNENRLLSPTISEFSKCGETRDQSVINSEISNDSKFRRYARINNFEFDINDLNRKRIKALEYSRALGQLCDEKQKKRVEEHERLKLEDQLLEKKIMKQRIKMKNDYELERKLIEEKQEIIDKRREAVVAAINKTPIIKRRDFLTDSVTDSSQPPVTVAAIKPQTRTKEVSAQTDELPNSTQYCNTGTQTDVQLLLNLIKEIGFTPTEKSKTFSKPADNLLSHTNSTLIATTPKIFKRTVEKSEKVLPKKSVLGSNQQLRICGKNSIKTSNRKKQEIKYKANDNEMKNSVMFGNRGNIKEDKSENMDQISGFKLEETDHTLNSLRRNSISLTSIDIKNMTENNQRIYSSVDRKSNLNFLPQISARPHSRKKWYSQEKFDLNILN